MNTWVVTALVFLAALGGAPKAWGQVDGCLAIAFAGDSTVVNKDSVMVDTCRSTQTHYVFYARKWYEIIFDQSVIRLPWAPRDSVVEVTWHTVDTAYPAIRSALQDIENKFGMYYLRKEDPEDTIVSSVDSRSYMIRFDSLVNADSVMPLLRAVPNSTSDFKSRPSPLTYVQGEKQGGDPTYLIFPNPVTDRGLIFLSGAKTALNNIHAEIIDATGKVFRRFHIRNQRETPIDFSGLAQGTYLLIIGDQSIKIIKQ